MGKLLIHIRPISHFYVPWKHQKTSGFQMFSGDIALTISRYTVVLILNQIFVLWQAFWFSKSCKKNSVLKTLVASIDLYWIILNFLTSSWKNIVMWWLKDDTHTLIPTLGIIIKFDVGRVCVSVAKPVAILTQSFLRFFVTHWLRITKYTIINLSFFTPTTIEAYKTR